MLDIQRVKLNNGTYLLYMSFKDKNSPVEAVEIKDVIKMDYRENELAVSDVQIIMPPKKSTSKKIPIKGKISQIEFSDDNELVFVLSKDEEKYTVTILESFIYPMASFSFEGECSFIKTYENSIFIGRNTKISKISISKK